MPTAVNPPSSSPAKPRRLRAAGLRGRGGASSLLRLSNNAGHGLFSGASLAGWTRLRLLGTDAAGADPTPLITPLWPSSGVAAPIANAGQSTPC